MAFTDLPETVAQSEGLKRETSIGNVREGIRLVLTTLANLPADETTALLAKYSAKGEKSGKA